MKNSIFVSRATADCLSYALGNLMDPVDIEGKRIIIKPNVRSCHVPAKAKNTNPITLDCVLAYLRKNYNNEIIVVDSSIIGVDTRESAKVSGIQGVCDKYNVAFCDLRDYGFRRVEISIAPYYMEISELFFENNFVINMPKLKSTYGFPLSLSAKNLKGIISDQSKLDFHTYGVQDRVALLNSLIHSNLSIVDGLFSLSLDTVLETNLIFASNNSLALDYFIAKKMGYTEKEMRYLASAPKECDIYYSDDAVKREFESLNLNSISPTKVQDQFGVSIIGTPCSACTGCIYKAIAKRKKRVYKKIVAGNYKQYTEDECIFVGNCASGNFAANPTNTVIGCPPQISDIIRKLDEGG